MKSNPCFHRRENAILTLFQRLDLGQWRALRCYGDGRIHIDYVPSWNAKTKTLKGRAVGQTFGKVTVYLRRKQFTANIIGGGAE